MRDPDCRLEVQAARVVRSFNQPIEESHSLRSKAVAALVAAGKILPFELEGSDRLSARRIPFVTFPHEWGVSQLASAAVLTLDISLGLIQSGLELKDASAWNVIFDGCVPRLSDHGSIAPAKDGQWWAYGQFVRHFVLPLALDKRGVLRADQAFLLYRDGVPPDFARRLMGASRWTTLAGWMTMSLGSGGSSKGALAAEPRGSTWVASQRERLYSSLRSLISEPSNKVTTWSGYEADRGHYVSEDLQKKKATIQDWLRMAAPDWVLDVGCNSGEYSMLAADTGAKVIAADFDAQCISQVYRRASGRRDIFPAVVNMDDVGAGRGWGGIEYGGFFERCKRVMPTTMLLAVVHHLAIAIAVPLREIAALFAQLSDRVILELVDSSDPMLQLLCAQRKRDPAEFSADRQLQAFLNAGFVATSVVDLALSNRRLVLLEKA